VQGQIDVEAGSGPRHIAIHGEWSRSTLSSTSVNFE
jgi:hypothetical protein